MFPETMTEIPEDHKEFHIDSITNNWTFLLESVTQEIQKDKIGQNETEII